MAMSTFATVYSEAERYATTLHTAWGVGDSTLQNGCVIFLSVEDRVVHITYGKGIHDKISSVDNQKIIEHMKPMLQQKDYGDAISLAIVEINAFVTRAPSDAFEHQKKRDKRHFVARKVGPWLLGGFFAILSVMFCYSGFKEKKIKRAHAALKRMLGHMQRLEHAVDDLTKLEPPVADSSGNTCRFTNESLCPMCLEEFIPQSGEPSEGADQSEVNGNGIIESSTADPTAENTDILQQQEEYASYDDLVTAQLEDRKRNGEKTSGWGKNKRIPVVYVDTSLSKDSFKYSAAPLQIRCGHVFCGCCLQLHMNSNSAHSSSCPICNVSIDITADKEPSTQTAHMNSASTSAAGAGSYKAGGGGRTDWILSEARQQEIQYMTARLCAIYKSNIAATLSRDVGDAMERVGTVKSVVSALAGHYNALSQELREIEARKRNMDAGTTSRHRPPLSRDKDSIGKNS
jgi:uncharacterized membrane protein YgcG